MARTKIKNKTQPEGVYFLKIVLYVIVGSQWVWLTNNTMTKQLPLPIGLILGGIFAGHDHFIIDRKIEYAVLLIACLVGFWSQIGLVIAVLK